MSANPSNKHMISRSVSTNVPKLNNNNHERTVGPSVNPEDFNSVDEETWELWLIRKKWENQLGHFLRKKFELIKNNFAWALGIGLGLEYAGSFFFQSASVS